jgi:hypothetical protein
MIVVQLKSSYEAFKARRPALALLGSRPSPMHLMHAMTITIVDAQSCLWSWILHVCMAV